MARDGSSGGVIRMCVITEGGVERKFVPGDQLPKFWEGHEVLGKPTSLKAEGGLAPMAVCSEVLTGVYPVSDDFCIPH